MKREILNAIRAWMGSQCSCLSIGVMWSLGLSSFIRRAAVCSNEDKGLTSSTTVAVVESGDDESLNKNTTACFFEGGKSMFRPWRRHVVSCLVCSPEKHRGHESHCIVGQD